MSEAREYDDGEEREGEDEWESEDSWESDVDSEVEIAELMQMHLSDGATFSGKQEYLAKCSDLHIVPVAMFIAKLECEHINLRHHGMGGKGARALAVALLVNSKVRSLNLGDNWFGDEGVHAVAEVSRLHSAVARPTRPATRPHRRCAPATLPVHHVEAIPGRSWPPTRRSRRSTFRTTTSGYPASRSYAAGYRHVGPATPPAALPPPARCRTPPPPHRRRSQPLAAVAPPHEAAASPHAASSRPCSHKNATLAESVHTMYMLCACDVHGVCVGCAWGCM